jgi:hypothetical protein
MPRKRVSEKRQPGKAPAPERRRTKPGVAEPAKRVKNEPAKPNPIRPSKAIPRTHN